MKKIMPSRPDWFLSCLRSRHEVQSFGGITIQKVERLDENVIQEFQSTLFYSPDYFELWFVGRPGGIRARARLAATKNLGLHRRHAAMETLRCFRFVPAKKPPGRAVG